jgi:hypothetical protein
LAINYSSFCQKNIPDQGLINIGIFKSAKQIKASIPSFNDMSFEDNISESDTVNTISFTSDYIGWSEDPSPLCIEQSLIFNTTSESDVLEIFEQLGFVRDDNHLIKKEKMGTIIAMIAPRKNDSFEVEYISATLVADR